MGHRQTVETQAASYLVPNCLLTECTFKFNENYHPRMLKFEMDSPVRLIRVGNSIRIEWVNSVKGTATFKASESY